MNVFLFHTSSVHLENLICSIRKTTLILTLEKNSALVKLHFFVII